MSRNLVVEAIVLKADRLQEFHKSVTLLCAELGIIRGVAHGVYLGKGKLGSASDPFACSRTYLYYNPVKRSYKITEMEPLDLFAELRADLDRFYNASLMAEVILKSFGGGGPESTGRCYDLLKEALAALDRGAETTRVRVQFLWRFVGQLGFMPSLERCESCGRSGREAAGLVYRVSEGDFVCEACARSAPDSPRGATIPLSAEAARYLLLSSAMGLPEAVAVDVDPGSMRGLVRVLHTLIQEIVEAPIQTLKAGIL